MFQKGCAEKYPTLSGEKVCIQNVHFDTPLISDGKERLGWVVDSSQKLFTFATRKALVAKLVDAPDLGSGVARRVGSSPIRRTPNS